MPPRPPVPPALARALRKARVVELAAARADQRLAAIKAGANLMRAAVDAGWYVSEIAPAMGIKAGTARKRIKAAREMHPRPVRGLVVPAPAPKSVTVDPFTAYLSTPVDQREWLTSREAMRLTGLSLYGLRSWRRAGLLPNTQWINPTRGFYLRSDLERVLAAPAYNNRGHSHAAVRVAIEAEGDVAPTQVG